MPHCAMKAKRDTLHCAKSPMVVTSVPTGANSTQGAQEWDQADGPISRFGTRAAKAVLHFTCIGAEDLQEDHFT